MIKYSFVGVDIAKDKFDVAVEINEKHRSAKFENTPAGFKAFFSWLKELPDMPWVAMEATGHYGDLLAIFLSNKKIHTSVINPKCIKHFSISILARNKTDKQDAKVIAAYAKAAKLREFTPKTEAQTEIRDLTRTLEMLKEQKVQLQNQLGATLTKKTKRFLEKTLRQLSKQIAEIEKAIKELVESDEHFARLSNLLKTIPGIADLTAHKLLAHLPDLTAFENVKEFAAYMGVTPVQQQSGKWMGQSRMSKLGNSKLRRALYMPAISAKRFNQALSPFVQRLQEKGLKPKAIIGAVMRKLAHMIYGVLKSGQPYNPKLV